MNWPAISELISDASHDPTVMATVLVAGFAFLLWIGRYGGNR